MTKVIHSIENKEITKEIDNPSFILTNKIGGFLFLSNQRISRHQGFFIHDGNNLFKIVENIYPEEEENITQVKNNLYSIQRKRGLNYNEEFFVPFGSNTLIYTSDEARNLILELDMKINHDNKEMGRNYKISDKKGKIIIEFTRNDGLYKTYAVMNKEKYEKLERWPKQYYPFDHQRNSSPWDWHIFQAIKIKTDTLIITAGPDLKKVLEEHDFMQDEYKKMYQNQKDVKFQRSIRKKDINFAYSLAAHSVNSLTTTINNKRGIFAGLPWFYQFWTRDEAISLKSSIQSRRYDSVKRIILRQIQNIQKDGRLQNRIPDSELGSADGVGWFFKRVGDFHDILQVKNLLYHVFTKDELNIIKKQLEKSIYSILKNYSDDGLIKNDALETWMDTGIFMHDLREGVRVEINALFICMVDLLSRMSKHLGDDPTHNFAKDLEARLIKKFKEAFWTGKYLRDGRFDDTIRPNPFIVYYVCPQALSKSEWITCFDTILPKLWLDWGGITTIERGHPNFTDYHTGQDNRSYHRGDSWYWMNNLAALCMHKLAPLKFSKYIKNIINASTDELLWSGAIGHHAEISSAKQRDSNGCFMQAWSAAMYIELVNEIY